MKMLSVRLDDAQAAALRAACEASGLTQSQFIKRSISHSFAQLEQRKTPAELAQKYGIVGCFDGESNLSEKVGHYFRKKSREKTAR